MAKPAAVLTASWPGRLLGGILGVVLGFLGGFIGLARDSAAFVGRALPSLIPGLVVGVVLLALSGWPRLLVDEDGIRARLLLRERRYAWGDLQRIAAGGHVLGWWLTVWPVGDRWRFRGRMLRCS